MKELHGVSANTIAILYQGDRDNVLGGAEVVLIVGEPEYRHDEFTDGVRTGRCLETMRFFVNTRSIDLLIKSLEGARDDMLAFEAKMPPDAE